MGSTAFYGGGGAMIHAYRGKTPRVHPSVFLAESAEIIGDVVIGKDWLAACKM